MTTALNIITDALELIGIYGPGDQLSAADSARSLFVLNAMIDEFASQSILIYALESLTAPVTSGNAQYTIGESGASVTAQRPAKIAYGDAAASITVGGTTTYVNVVSAIEYQSLAGFSPGSGTPDTLWYNPAYPLGMLNLLPTPSANGTLSFAAWQRIASFPALTTAATLATGALDGIRYNLAVAIAPYFTSAPVDQGIVVKAAMSKDFLRIQSLSSRAMMNRFVFSANPAKAP